MNSFLPLLVTLLIQAFSALALMAVPVLVPALASVEGGPPRLTAAGIGGYLLFGYLGAVIGSLSAGSLVDRWGAIRTSQGALLLSGLGLVLAAVAPMALPLAALLIGLGYGPITPASSHVLIRTTPAPRLNLVFSIKQTGVPLGVAMSGFSIPPLAAATGWGWTLVVLALACAVVAAMAQPIQRALDAETATEHPGGVVPALTFKLLGSKLVKPLAVIFGHKTLRALAAVSFVLSGIQISLSSYLVTYLTAEMALTAVVAGSVLGLSQMGGVLGRVVWGFLADHVITPLRMLGTLALVIALASGATAALAQWHIVPPGVLLAVLMFVFGASASGWNGVYLAEVARQAPPGSAGMATSGTLACTFLGVIAGAPLFGLIAASPAGFSAAFGMQALLALGVAVLLFVFSARRAPPAG